MSEPIVAVWQRTVSLWKLHKGKWHWFPAGLALGAESACGHVEQRTRRFTETWQAVPAQGRICKHCAKAAAREPGA